MGRGHHNSGSVFVLNLFLGWTFVGWVVALAMAYGHVKREPDRVEVVPITLFPKSTAHTDEAWWNRYELIIVPGLVIAAVAVLALAFSSIVKPNRPPSLRVENYRPSVAVTPSAALIAPSPDSTPPLPDAWQVSEDRSAMDGSKTVFLSLYAEYAIQGWLKTDLPRLHIRCQEHKTAVMIETGMAAQPELGSYEQVTVEIRLDKRPKKNQRWLESTNHEALFSPNAIAFARQLSRSNTLFLRFTPFNSSPQIVTFDLRGLAAHLSTVSAACKWGRTGSDS